MTQDRISPQPRGPSRLMRIVLVVSLGLNLMVAALVISALVMHGRWGPHHGPSGLAGGALTRALDRADRQALHNQMRQSYPASSDPRAEMRQTFHAFAALLRQDPFDASAAQALLEQHRSGFHARLELGQGLLITRLATMTAAERSAYADRLDEALTHHQTRRHRWRHREE